MNTTNFIHNDQSMTSQRAMLAVILSLMAFSGTPTLAQESSSPRPTRIDTSTDRQVDQTTLIYGMSRPHVLELLGPPAIESVIGSLGRTRAEYEDHLVLLFEDQRLIAIKSAVEPEPLQDGRWMLVREEATDIRFEPDLMLIDIDPLPHGEDRRGIDDQFYFQQTSGDSDAYDIPFTPATPECLLDNCPGCHGCGQGCPNGVQGASPCACDDYSSTVGDRKGGYRNDWILHFSADALFLDRNANDFSTTFLQGATTAQTSLLRHGLTPGLRATLGANLTDQTGLELVYIGSHQWEADGSNTNLLPPGLGILASNESYRAELDDFQINLVHRPEGKTWSLLAGVRYTDQSDQFSVDLTGSLPLGAARNPLNLQGEAVNRSIGLQVGGSQTWQCGRFQLFGQIKLGALHNQIDQSGPAFIGSVDLTSNPAATDINFFTDNDEGVSFVGDFVCSVRYPVLDSAWLRLGYQGLLFSDIAQVPQQDGQAAAPDTLAYNGIFAGLVLEY